MASIGDVYRLQAFYTTAGGGPAVDSYYYEVGDASGANAENLLGAWRDKFEGLILPFLSDILDIFEYVVINGMDNGDFHVDATGYSGTATGGTLPPGLCPIFQSGRSQPGDRYSWHRPPLGVIPALASGGVWTPGFQDALNDIAFGLNDNLTHSPGAIYAPVQVTGGFKLGTEPVIRRPLSQNWSYGTQPHWLDSREPEFVYIAAS